MLDCECGAELIQDDCETILNVCQEAPVIKDYEALVNKPQINGVTLQGNKTSEDLGITQEIENAVSAEATLRENADTALGGRIDDEVTSRENADTALGQRIDGEITNRTNADNALGTRIDNEILARQGGDNNLQTQIDAITSKSDVVDVVADYAALQAYDTQHLGNNDIIKVLDDETHNDAQTYYRWNKTAGTWSYIGSEAPYYSKGQMDTMLQAKQDKLIAGTNIQIAQDGKTISATDTTYTAGNGLNLNGTEFSADTTVLATKTDLDSYYTKTETDTKLAPKLETEIVSTLPTTGDEGKLYLTPKNYTTGTASGNPITATITDEAGQIESFQLDGDTFQQTYTGKNLLGLKTPSSNTFGFEPVVAEEPGTITVNGTFTGGGGGFPWISDRQLSIPAGTYTFSMKNPQSFNVSLRMFDAQGQYTSGKYIAAGATSGTFTLEYDCVRVAILIGAFSVGKTLDNQKFEELQLEAGSTKTSFEPYVGGTASPNPDYPQQIQTVTGTQTISINGTDYPINLGSLELCKLGTYQDYIWKDGEDWKVHKETKSVTLDENDDWTKREYGTNAYHVLRPDISTAQSKICIASQYFRGVSYNDRQNNQSNIIFADSTAGMAVDTRGITIRNSPWSDLSSFLSWISSKAITCLYVLLESTDTTITDQTLIAQLEAVRTAALSTGSNTISNTATGTNLAGDMEYDYHEYNPTNRYDKWVWLDINNEYEQIGS